MSTQMHQLDIEAIDAMQQAIDHVKCGTPALKQLLQGFRGQLEMQRYISECSIVSPDEGLGDRDWGTVLEYLETDGGVFPKAS